MYFNTATNTATETAPIISPCALLADDMGLGKTIQILSLILSDPTGANVVEFPTTIINPDSAKTTLIVCPLSVMGNWTEQIERHVKPGCMTYYVYHGTSRNSSPKFLKEFDVVITTCMCAFAISFAMCTILIATPLDQTLSATLNKKGSGLQAIRWRRIVLDEGHIIRNHKSKMAQAAFNLQGRPLSIPYYFQHYLTCTNPTSRS